LAQSLTPRVAAPVAAKDIPLSKPITIDSRKRKGDDENAHSVSLFETNFKLKLND
jgi:hypothetical protein